MSETLLQKFLHGVFDRINALGENIASLEDDQSTGLLRKIGRDLHTLKGEARLVGVVDVERLAHCAEDVLFAHQSAKTVGPATQQALYEAVDAVFHVVEALKSNATYQRDDVEAVLGRLRANLPPASDAAQAVAEPAAPNENPTPVRDNSRGNEGEMRKVRASHLETLTQLTSATQGSALLLKQYANELWLLAQKIHKLAHVENARQLDLAQLLDASRGLSKTTRALRDKLSAEESIHKELVNVVRASRLQPLSSVLGAYPNHARQIARGLDKSVKLSMDNIDVELEQDVLDAIAEPIMHLLRNAIGHGLETPKERIAAGKAETGLIQITATQRGDTVRIDFSDDGRGFDLGKIGTKAVALGVVTEKELARMTDADRTNLVFHPGLSTRDAVDEISGRGIGMDVVASAIAKLGGSVNIETQLGRGTQVCLRIPVSASNMRVMLVESCDNKFAIPSAAVREVFWLNVKDIRREAGCEFASYRGGVVPLVRLREALGLGGIKDIFLNKVVVVIIEVGRTMTGVIVERCLGERDLIAHPLTGFLERTQTTTSTVFLEDDSVVVVLNAESLLDATGPSSRAGLNEGSQASDAARQRHVLYAEDSVITREYTANLLRAEGYVVTEVEDGLAALEALAREHYDLLLTDLQMPRMDGLQLISAVRRDSRWKNLPIVIMSTVDQTDTKKMALQSGADAYLVKSQFGANALFSALRQVLA